MSILIGPAWGLIPLAIAASLTYNWQSENPPLFAFLTYKDKVMPILNNPQAHNSKETICICTEGAYNLSSPLYYNE